MSNETDDDMGDLWGSYDLHSPALLATSTPSPTPKPVQAQAPTATKVPEDPEAERAFITTVAFLGSSPRGFDAASKLGPEDFVDPRHRLIFQAIRVLQEKDSEVSALTIKNEIESLGALGQVGGFASIVEILSGDEVERPEVLADILREKTNLRSLAAMGSRIAERALGPSSSTEILSEASEAITRLQSGTTSKQIITDMMGLLEKMEDHLPLASANLGKAMSWGDPTLDSIAPIPRGEPTLVVARPGVGKSALAIQIHAATIEQGLGTPLFLSLEMNEEMVRARLGAHLCGVNSRDLLAGSYDEHATARVRSRASVLTGKFMFPSQQCPVEEIESLVRHAVDIYGVDCVILDQFSHIHPPKEAKKETFAISNSILSQRLTALAKNLNLGWVTLGQINRDGEDSRRPNMKDLADTDRLCKDAAIIFGLWNKGPDENQEVHGVLMKNRHGGYKGWSKQIDVDYGSCRFIVREQSTDSSFHPPIPKGWA